MLERYLDAIMIRTFAQEDVEQLAEHAEIPVINGLTDYAHPCQALADLMTIREKLGRLSGARLAYLGDSVLALAVAADLYERFGEIDAGGLTKIHNQTVSGVSCAEVGRQLGVPDMMRASEPEAMQVGIPAEVLLGGERPLPTRSFASKPSRS